MVRGWPKCYCVVGAQLDVYMCMYTNRKCAFVDVWSEMAYYVHTCNLSRENVKVVTRARYVACKVTICARERCYVRT